MPRPERTGSLASRAGRTWFYLAARHDNRTRAAISSPRGWMWSALLAASLFWMSNPLVFVREFDDSLAMTTTWTLVAALVSLPWLRIPRVPWPWLAFLALCVASQLWTVDDQATDTSIVLYLRITAVALVVAANCDALVVAWGLGLGGVVVVALSIYAFEKTMWGSSYPIEGGLAFTGVGTNENILAYTLAVSLAATLAVGRPSRWAWQAAWVLVLAVNAYGLWLANSGTGFVAALAVATAWASTILWPRLGRAGRRAALIWVGAATSALVLILVLLSTLLGKQVSTVSGRSPFWVAAFESTMDRAPLVGSGWGAVWEHPWDLTVPNDVTRDIYERAGFSLPHGHNFFVDVLPELGLVGVGIALLMVAYAVSQTRSNGLHAGSVDPVSGRLVLLVLVALLVSGVSEPMLTVPLGWWTLTLVVALPGQHAPGPAASTRRSQSQRGRRAAPRETRLEPIR